MWSYPVLDPVSQAYPRAEGRSPTCYSPVRRSCTPERALPLDLHVLSTPPAFVLSQDQTLQQKLALASAPTSGRGRTQSKQNIKLAQTPPVRTNKLDTLLSSQKTPGHPHSTARQSVEALSVLHFPPYTVRNSVVPGGPGGIFSGPGDRSPRGSFCPASR